jgi:hypothetical protein
MSIRLSAALLCRVFAGLSLGRNFIADFYLHHIFDRPPGCTRQYFVSLTLVLRFSLIIQRFVYDIDIFMETIVA